MNGTPLRAAMAVAAALALTLPLTACGKKGLLEPPPKAEKAEKNS